jgi:hypothetical protein
MTNIFDRLTEKYNACGMTRNAEFLCIDVKDKIKKEDVNA